MTGKDPYRHRGGYGATGGDDCGDISLVTQVVSPNPDVIPKLKIGQTVFLKVISIEYNSPKDTLYVFNGDNETIGSIISAKALKIINCIKQGHSFKATIKTLEGGNCDVSIEG